jgi:hypothetical protein
MVESVHNGPYSRISATTSTTATTASAKATPKLTVAPATSATRPRIVKPQPASYLSAPIVGRAAHHDQPATSSTQASNHPRLAWVVVASRAGPTALGWTAGLRRPVRTRVGGHPGTTGLGGEDRPARFAAGWEPQCGPGAQQGEGALRPLAPGDRRGRYGQVSRSFSNSTVTVPSACRVTCATTWRESLEPSEPFAMELIVTVAVKLFWLLRFAPAQNVPLPV